ncbi:MAG: RagB/SusD family nutrient uptake outer membrane protein [Candidatus Cryptobacteroides sp.]
MKKIFTILALMGAFATSCSWLDITPEDTVVEEDLFSESTGFHNAINGLYKTMSATELYGRELSYGFVEVLSRNYINGYSDWYNDGISNYSSYYPLFKYDYEGTEAVQRIIENIWGRAYFVIANANSIVAEIEALAPDKFKYGQEEMNLIKGEALAVRAMMHFDLLRLFAPAPCVADNQPYIPYVEVSPYYGGQARETVEAVMKKIERDLVEAKELIKSYDTMGEDQLSRLSTWAKFQLPTGASNYSAFYEYRGYRINYLAVTGLLARVYNYWGKHSEAFAQAGEVADFVYDKERGYKALEYSNDNQTQYDRKFSSDLIFCLSDTKMTENYQPYSITTSYDFLNINADVVKFEGVPEADMGDNRLRYQVERVENWAGGCAYRPLKYLKLDSSQDIAGRVADMLPIMRLSEMHFIMAEAKAAEGNYSEADGANYYLNLIREGRNCRKINLGITDMDTFKAQLFMEVRKECFSEGQTFYYYKKYNEPLISGMTPENFVVPVPQTENVN